MLVSGGDSGHEHLVKILCSTELRAMILGEDWLKKNQVQIRFKPNLLSIKGVKIPLGRGSKRIMVVYSEDDFK